MRRLWLLFAQTATVCLAILFIVSTLKPEWINRIPTSGHGLHFATSTLPITEAPVNAVAPGSYRDAAKRAMPSVVNIFTTKEIKQTVNPFFNDPLFRHFFGNRPNPRPQKQSSLGSGVIVSTTGYIITNNHVVNSADEIDGEEAGDDEADEDEVKDDEIDGKKR